jgi:hypothetical protein
VYEHIFKYMQICVYRYVHKIAVDCYILPLIVLSLEQIIHRYIQILMYIYMPICTQKCIDIHINCWMKCLTFYCSVPGARMHVHTDIYINSYANKYTNVRMKIHICIVVGCCILPFIVLSLEQVYNKPAPPHFTHSTLSECPDIVTSHWPIQNIHILMYLNGYTLINIYTYVNI